MSQEITVKSTRASICTAKASELLEISYLASRTLERSINAGNTKFVAWLAFFSPIFVVAFRATIYNYTPLFSLNELERGVAFSTVVVSGSIAVSAFCIAPVAFLYSRSLIKATKEPLRTHFQVDFSHFYYF